MEEIILILIGMFLAVSTIAIYDYCKKRQNGKPELKIADLQRIHIKDDDILVIKYPYKLSSKQYEQLQIAFQTDIKKLGVKIKVIILEDGMALEAVLSKMVNNYDYIT